MYQNHNLNCPELSHCSPEPFLVKTSEVLLLTCYTHVILIKYISKTITDYTVLQGGLPHFHSSSHMN